MTEELKRLKQEADEAQKKARLARAALEHAEAVVAAARMEPLRNLVERAHKLLCAWNHTDGCGWGYEEGDKSPWGCSEHLRWLRHYDLLINGSTSEPPNVTIDEVTAILDAIEGLKPKAKTALFLIRHGRLMP